MMTAVRRRALWHFVVGCAAILCKNLIFFVHAQHPEVECTPASVDYDWERWNYYELLGLVRPSDPSVPIDSRSVRKAYRQQAQIWHPDKQTNTNTTASKEESNARFTRIAQAYEVLNDDWRRKEYDLFLHYCDSQDDLIPEQKPRWSELLSKIDPFSVFEEMFGGHNRNREEEADDDSWFFDMPPQNTDPVRIIKHQDEFREGMDEIVRASQTEEYAPDGNGRYYYRVISQEFVKRVDPYTGNVVLQPLTSPYLREEGHQKVRSSQLPRQSLLFPGDILTPSSALLVSPNRRYYAGLSPDCELLVMAENAFGEDGLVWSSYSPFASNRATNQQYHQEFCFATLRGPHLVIALGQPEVPHRILWYSEANEDNERPGTMDTGRRSSFHSTPSTHLVQLENDGSLVVYKVFSESPYFQELPLSSRAWVMARNFVEGASRDDMYESLLKGSASLNSDTPTYKRCIFATGPLGCHRLARRLYQLSLEIFFRVKSIMGKMDNMFDAWMDLILEEESYLQALKQSTSGIGSRVVMKSARLVRKVLELIMLRGEK